MDTDGTGAGSSEEFAESPFEGLLARLSDLIDKKLAPIIADVSDLRADVGDLRVDVGNLRADVGNLRADVGNLRADVGDLRADFGRLERKVDKLDSNFNGFTIFPTIGCRPSRALQLL